MVWLISNKFQQIPIFYQKWKNWLSKFKDKMPFSFIVWLEKNKFVRVAKKHVIDKITVFKDVFYAYLKQIWYFSGFEDKNRCCQWVSRCLGLLMARTDHQRLIAMDNCFQSHNLLLRLMLSSYFPAVQNKQFLELLLASQVRGFQIT